MVVGKAVGGSTSNRQCFQLEFPRFFFGAYGTLSCSGVDMEFSPQPLATLEGFLPPINSRLHTLQTFTQKISRLCSSYYSLKALCRISSGFNSLYLDGFLLGWHRYFRQEFNPELSPCLETDTFRLCCSLGIHARLAMICLVSNSSGFVYHWIKITSKNIQKWDTILILSPQWPSSTCIGASTDVPMGDGKTKIGGCVYLFGCHITQVLTSLWLVQKPPFLKRPRWKIVGTGKVSRLFGLDTYFRDHKTSRCCMFGRIQILNGYPAYHLVILRPGRCCGMNACDMLQWKSVKSGNVQEARRSM